MAPLPGSAGDAIDRVVLANGLTVLIRRDASAPVVAIVTHVKAGYFDESDDAGGVAHVLEHMYFKGTPARPPGEIARETKAAGGYLNAGTIYDQTSYYTVLPSSGLLAGLEVQSDAYAHSLIDAEELRRELEVIIEEERRKRDTPSAVATEACYALLHDVHRMRRWRIGTPEGLRRLTRDDVLRFYRTYYVPSNTILSVVGDVDPAATLRDIERLYGSLPAGTAPRDRGPSEPDRRDFRWQDLSRDVAQSQSVMGWRTVRATHEDVAALDVSAEVLAAGRASRLYREVREQSLASSVGAYHYTPTEIGVFAVNTEAEHEKLPDAVAASWEQVRQLTNGGVDQQELARVKRGIEARVLRRLESMEGQATYLASWEAMGGWSLGAEYLDELLAVRGEDVQRVAATYLTLDRAALVTMRGEGARPIAGSVAEARALLDAAHPSPRAAAETPAVVPAHPAVRVTPERIEAGVSIYSTAGGVPILARRKPGARIAHVQVMFVGGAIHETANTAGTTTLMARAALKGTSTHDARMLAEAVESLGGAIGNSVGVEGFGWTLSVPLSGFDAALRLLADVVQRPSFPSEVLETERSIALAGLSRLRDDMSRQPSRLALAATFGDHPYGRPALGTADGLASCTIERLRAAHQETVVRGHGVIGVVADLPEDEMAASVRAVFTETTQESRPSTVHASWPGEARESVEERDKAQTALTVMFEGPSRESPDRRAAGLLGTVASGLGGRFFQTLRDRESLAYTVSLGSRALPGAGWMGAYLACAPEKEDAARNGLIRECMRLATEPVSDEELSRAKAYTLGSLAIRQQSTGAVLSDIVDAFLFETLEELIHESEEIAALSSRDLQTVAEASFSSGTAVWGVVRGKR
jgi:zinc protease